MARIDFINQLKALGFQTQELNNSIVCISFDIPIGVNKGKQALLGFQVQDDFPMNCPAGLHFNASDLSDWKEPKQNVSDSPLGPGWRYWSRRFPDWNRTDRTVKTFLAHVRNILTRIE
ncbi:MAG: hypothetical protein KF860_14825 [Cyclobacteriaceae bacterium]|nr:hypothetical protein [Cyclobacteriaceae bacterium]